VINPASGPNALTSGGTTKPQTGPTQLPWFFGRGVGGRFSHLLAGGAPAKFPLIWPHLSFFLLKWPSKTSGRKTFFSWRRLSKVGTRGGGGAKGSGTGGRAGARTRKCFAELSRILQGGGRFETKNVKTKATIRVLSGFSAKMTRNFAG